MKHINKNIANEPSSLRESRNDEFNATYETANFDMEALKQALLDEQGYICAYCMGRIGLELNDYFKPKVEVEHLKPREIYPTLGLDYNNLMAVCNGLSKAYPEKGAFHHCDKTKGTEGKMNGKVELKKINPLSKADSEDLLCYDLAGKIKSKNDSEEVNHDLNVVLNLNNDMLVRYRKKILDVVKDVLIKEKPVQQWTKKLFDKHLEKWESRKDDKYKPYCMIAVWFLENLKSKPQYKD